MSDQQHLSSHERWAQFRFSVVGQLLAAPPAKGELHGELTVLAKKWWDHPITGRLEKFGLSTIERWYHDSRKANDPIGKLRRKVRKDAGQQHSVTDQQRQLLFEQYHAHPTWSYKLHHDNLAALLDRAQDLGRMPSCSSVRRYMKAAGLIKQRRRKRKFKGGEITVELGLTDREVRSFEAEYVNGLWHLDFHHCSRKVLLPDGQRIKPLLLGIIDDRSRLACHLQWYLGETAENLIHGLCQALMKRQLPRVLMSDNGSAMVAAETRQGLSRLSIIQEFTLPRSPYQNGKQEAFWNQIEGRLMPMLEGHAELTLQLLNEATQAWVEQEYNRAVHKAINQTPVERYLAGPEVGLDSPSAKALRLAFTVEETRTQRKSDGTITLDGTRFEIPSRYRQLKHLNARLASWDLSFVHLVDPRTGIVLCPIFPQDKERNADGRRRLLTPKPVVAEPDREAGIAPLLQQQMQAYAETGLPPAYLPKNEDPNTDVEVHHETPSRKEEE